MKIKNRSRRRMFLKPVDLDRKKRKISRGFRTYANLKKFGWRSGTVNTKNKLKMRGYGSSEVTGRGFITDNDNSWISSLNPYDKVIAKNSVKTLKALQKLLKTFNISYDSNEKVSDQIQKLKAAKEEIVQKLLGYDKYGSVNKSISNAFKNIMKDFGINVLGFFGFQGVGGLSSLETSGEKKIAIQSALDDYLNQVRTKSQEAYSILQQLYLKQGDREEQREIRKKEEEKQLELRKQDKVDTLPTYQTVEEVNPLGYVARRRYLKVDPDNERQVKSARNNPFLREQDRSYFDKSRVQPLNFSGGGEKHNPKLEQNKIKHSTPVW